MRYLLYRMDQLTHKFLPFRLHWQHVKHTILSYSANADHISMTSSTKAIWSLTAHTAKGGVWMNTTSQAEEDVILAQVCKEE